MIKWLIRLLVVVIVGVLVSGAYLYGLNQKPKEPIKPLSSMLLPANLQWIEQYGDNDRTMFGYNLAVILELVGKHEQRIKEIEENLKLKDKSNVKESERTKAGSG